MARRHFGDLLGMHEHALDLGRLIGAAHPAFDARIAAPAGREAGSSAERSPGAEPDQSDSRD